MFTSLTQIGTEEKLLMAVSKDGTFEDAERDITSEIGGHVAAYLGTNLYPMVVAEVADKRRWVSVDTGQSVVSWRVLWHFFVYPDGKVHIEDSD